MLDEEKIKSIIPTSQDIKLVFFFKKDPVSALFKHTEQYKDVICCIDMAFS